MFKVKLGSGILNTYFISDGDRNYMHRDGTILHDACEYWVGWEAAQAVLDKFQPAHVWKNGDIFKSHSNTMVYHKFFGHRGSAAVCVDPNTAVVGPSGDLEATMENAVFLYNICDRLDG